VGYTYTQDNSFKGKNLFSQKVLMFFEMMYTLSFKVIKKLHFEKKHIFTMFMVIV